MFLSVLKKCTTSKLISIGFFNVMKLIPFGFANEAKPHFKSLAMSKGSGITKHGKNRGREYHKEQEGSHPDGKK